MSRFKIERDYCFMKCEPGLLPEFSLYDLDSDGTRNYLIRPGPFPEDFEAERAAELQRQEAEAFRAIQANRHWRVIPDIDGGWMIRDHYGNIISEGITLMSAIEAARLWEAK